MIVTAFPDVFFFTSTYSFLMFMMKGKERVLQVEWIQHLRHNSAREAKYMVRNARFVAMFPSLSLSIAITHNLVPLAFTTL